MGIGREYFIVILKRNSEWRSELKVNEYYSAERVFYQKLKLLLNNLLSQLILIGNTEIKIHETRILPTDL